MLKKVVVLFHRRAKLSQRGEEARWMLKNWVGKGGETFRAMRVFKGVMGIFIVIGASSGIGKELAAQLVGAGHEVIGTYFSANEESGTLGVPMHRLNVLDENPDFSFIPEAINGLAYCPGAINLKPFARTKPDDFRVDYELQLIGAVKTIQAALPALKKSGAGSVVLFSTVAVQSGFGFHAIVSASKGAIEGLGRTLAAELAPTVRVNVVAPSLTDTPLAAPLLGNEERRASSAQRHPMKRVGTAADSASAAKFLLSNESGWMTGQVIHVDGGMGVVR